MRRRSILVMENTRVDIQALSSALYLGDDGIWYSAENQAISYPADGNERCFAVEDTSFWFNHRNRCIQSIVHAFPPPNNGAIFDIGGGNGFVARGLAAAGFEVVLLEPGQAGATIAKNRGIDNVICATTETAHIKPHALAAVGLFDVIEHIEHDQAFLQSIHGLMQPGAMLYATVPAFPVLWSDEDVLAGHFKRYTVGTISDTLTAAGFEMVFASYIFRLLPLPVFLLRTLPFKLGLLKKKRTVAIDPRDHVVKNGVFSRLLNYILAAELGHLQAKHPMHFGGSCLVVATRR